MKPPKSPMDHLEPELPNPVPDASAPPAVLSQPFPGVTHPVVHDEETKAGDGPFNHGVVEVASDLALAPTRGPINVIPLLSEVETHRQIEVATAFCQLLSEELYQWSHFPIELPPTVLHHMRSLNLKEEDIAACFSQPPNTDDLRESAWDFTKRKMRKLSWPMIDELRRTGAFSIPSKNYPNKPHVFQVTTLLQNGTAATKEQVVALLARGVEAVLFVPPTLITGRAIYNKILGISVVSGLWNCVGFVHDVVDLFVGLPWYKDMTADAAAAISAARSTWQLHGLVSTDQSPKCYRGDVFVARDGTRIDWRVLDSDTAENRTMMLRDILHDLKAAATVEWQAQEKEFQQHELATLADSGESIPVIAERVVVASVEREHAIFMTKIMETGLFDGVAPGILDTLLANGQAAVIVRQESQKLTEEYAAQVTALQEQLARDHPFLNRMWLWRKPRLSALRAQQDQHRVTELYSRCITRCQQSRLSQAVYLMQRDHVFVTEQRPMIDKAARSNPPTAARLPFTRRIWSPKHWHIHQRPHDNEYYVASKYDTINVSTGYPGWRLFAMLVSIYIYFNNGLFFGLASLFAGPLSFRALLSCNNYFPDKTCDPLTGAIVVNKQYEVTTLASRLGSLWRGVHSSIQQFERRDDTAMLGKNCSRIMYYVWYYLVVGLLGSVLLLAVFPALTALNTVLCIFTIVASPIWPIGLAMTAFIANVVLVDTRAPFRHLVSGSHPSANRWKTRYVCTVGFPLPMLILSVAVMGLGQILASFFAAGFAVLYGIAACVFAVLRGALRRVWDELVLWVVFVPFARQPLHNSCIARKVSGPGMGTAFFHVCDPIVPLLLLRVHLEETELALFKQNLFRVLEQPELHQKRLMASMMRAITGGGFSGAMLPSELLRSNSKYRTVLESSTSERSKQLNNLRAAIGRGSLKAIRLSQEGLDLLLDAATQLVTEFYTRRIFPRETGGSSRAPDGFWRARSLPEDHFAGLTRQLLQSLLSDRVLTPIEAEESGLRLRVKHVSLGSYFSNVMEGRVSTDLVKRDVLMRQVLTLSPGLRDIQRRNLPTIADMLLMDITKRSPGEKFQSEPPFCPSDCLAAPIMPSDWKCAKCGCANHVPAFKCSSCGEGKSSR